MAVERDARRQILGSESVGTNAVRNRQLIGVHSSRPPDGKVGIDERRASVAAAARRVDLQRDIELYLLGGVIGNDSDGVVECRGGDSREETAQGIEGKASRQGGQSRERDRAIGVSGDEPRDILGIGRPLGKGLGQESECPVVGRVGSHREGKGDDNG